MAVKWMFRVAIECKLERVHNALVMIHLWLFAQEFEALLLQQQVEAFFHAQFVRKGQVPTSWLMDFLWHETKEGEKLRL
jgi:hypothetical protein